MFESLPGFREFYPDVCARRNHIFRLWRQTAVRYGFYEYDAPVLEPLELFTQKSGDEIVGQLFAFKDKGGRDVALRPEMTPSLARMVGAKAASLKRPVKWFNIGEHYRYEKPQKGRTRSFFQFNADIFGEAGPGADVELIGLLIDTMRVCGLTPKHALVRLSDRKLWMLYLAGLGLDEDAALPVLSVIDKLDRDSREKSLEKLQPHFGDAAEDFLAKVDALRQIGSLEDLRAFFTAHAPHADLREQLEERLEQWASLLAGLDAMGHGDYIRIDLGIVRGLAYYTGFVFEAFEATGQGRALAGGGRYDSLLKKLGYADMPACGFGMGDVTFTDLLEERNLLPPVIQKPDIYVVIGGDAERAAALRDIAVLRQAGRVVEYPLRGVGFGKQFKLANASGATYALIYGEEEVKAGEIKIRNLQDGSEQQIRAASLPSWIQGS